jgi:arylsulfatase A-like enzyme
MRISRASFLCLLLAACGSGQSEGDEAGAGGPVARDASTLLWVVVEDLGSAYLAPYGYQGGETPHIDGLAEEGVLFTNHVTACTGINGSLASLLTGRYAQEHGVGSLTHRGQHALGDSQISLAKVLHEAGWQTLAMVSKPQLAPSLAGLDQGFEGWTGPGLHEGEPRGAGQVVLGAGPELCQALATDEPLFALVYLSDTANLKGRARAAAVPFLEPYLGPFRDSQPLVAAALDRVQEDAAGGAADLEKALRRGRGTPAYTALQQAKYDAAVSEVDAALGELLGWIEDAGRLDRATIVLSSSRGPRLQPSVPGSPAFSPELVRTPLLVRFPGGQPQARVSSLVSSIDLAPSLAESLSVGWPATSGRSWLPLLEGRADSTEALVFCESAGLDRRAVFDDEFSVEENRVAGTVIYRRSGMRVLDQELEGPDAARVAGLRQALTQHRQPAQVVVENGGMQVEVRWAFTEGFAGPAAVELTEGSRPARVSGLSGNAHLGAGDLRLIAEASRRELPLRLQFKWGDGPVPNLMIGTRPLSASLLPRLPQKGTASWPRGEDGNWLAADARLEQQGGTWWKLHVGTEPDQAGQEVTALVALYPPPALDEALNFSAGQELEVSHPPGREDVLIIRGRAPCVLQLEKKPSQDFGLAVQINGFSLGPEQIRLRDKYFGGSQGIDLYLPDWVAGETDSLLDSVSGSPQEGFLRVTRRGPNVSAGDRRPMSSEQRTFVRHLGGAE